MLCKSTNFQDVDKIDTVTPQSTVTPFSPESELVVGRDLLRVDGRRRVELLREVGQADE